MWAKLNERQRTYLRTLYECDQATESERANEPCGAIGTAHRRTNGAGRCTVLSHDVTPPTTGLRRRSLR